MRLKTLGPVPENLFAVFYDPNQIGSDEQKVCRETNLCRLLGYGSCPAQFLRIERVISLAVEDLGETERVVTLIGSPDGPVVAEYLPHFIGTHYKVNVGRELCDVAIERYRSLHGISSDALYSRPDPPAA